MWYTETSREVLVAPSEMPRCLNEFVPKKNVVELGAMTIRKKLSVGVSGIGFAVCIGRTVPDRAGS